MRVAGASSGCCARQAGQNRAAAGMVAPQVAQVLVALVSDGIRVYAPPGWLTPWMEAIAFGLSD